MAPAIGPTISGFILNYLYWRWMFLLCCRSRSQRWCLERWRIQNVTTPRRVPLDVLSVALSAFAFGGIVYGLSEIGVDAAPRALAAWVPLAAGAVIMALSSCGRSRCSGTIGRCWICAPSLQSISPSQCC